MALKEIAKKEDVLLREAGDFDSFTEKGTPVSADIILIEDSAASKAKKKVQIGNLPGGGGGGDMYKSTYDTDEDGIVDKAESVDDGIHSATATEIEDAVTKKHTQLCEAADFAKLDGIEPNADVTDADNVEDAITGASAVTDPTDAGVFATIISAALKKITWANIKATLKTYFDTIYADGAIEIIIGNGSDVITTGQKGHLEVPFDCEIVAATLLADQSGSIVIDIWKDTYANFPPTDADSITASAPPTLSSAQKSQDTTLTGWTKTLTKGDILAYNVDSASTVKRVLLSLKVTKS